MLFWTDVVLDQPLYRISAARKLMIWTAFSHHRPPDPSSHNKTPWPACCSMPWSLLCHFSLPFYGYKISLSPDNFLWQNWPLQHRPTQGIYCRSSDCLFPSFYCSISFRSLLPCNRMNNCPPLEICETEDWRQIIIFRWRITDYRWKHSANWLIFRIKTWMVS